MSHIGFKDTLKSFFFVLIILSVLVLGLAFKLGFGLSETLGALSLNILPAIMIALVFMPILIEVQRESFAFITRFVEWLFSRVWIA